MVAEQPSSYDPVPTGEEPHEPGDHVETTSLADEEPVSPLDATNAPTSHAGPPDQQVSRSNTQRTAYSETLETTRRHSSLSAFTQRLYGSVDPSLHSLIEKDTSAQKTTREYRHSKQRRRLLRLTIGEWFNSLFLCITYFGILWAYSKKDYIDVRQRRIFNALTTGNSLLLGVNLAASLRSYAKLLRWRMLAKTHRPLETFDLVLGCDSLMSVITLLRKARNSRTKWLPSRTQLLCVLWLLIHLAVTVLVGIVGLNYNLETSTEYVLLTKGTISILDLNALSTGNYLADLAAVQTWGLRGTVTRPLNWDAELEYSQTFYSTYDGHTFYYFQDMNANKTGTGHVTNRYIESYAYCHAYSITEGQHGDLPYVLYNDGSNDINQTLPAQPGPGGLLTISKFNSTCGPRCAEMNMFQAQSYPGTDLDGNNYTLYEGRFFVCNNTVPEVGDDTGPVGAEYAVTDLIARMLAGAIGWSSDPPTSDGTAMYATYTNSSEVGFYGTPEATDMASLLASFTMGAVSYMDDSSGMYRKYTSSSDQPVAAQYLHVTWRFAGSILAVIPFIHFWTLVAVIAWANHAIIKDDSHLAIAKVYHSLLQRLGDRGCLLQGDEIVDALENPMVKYGFSPSVAQDGYLHVDVFEKGSLVQCIDGPFREGWYDGTGSSRQDENAKASNGVLRSYRDIDAADYF